MQTILSTSFTSQKLVDTATNPGPFLRQLPDAIIFVYTNA